MVDATALQTIPFFREFSAADVAAVAGLMMERVCPPGELIFLEGEPNTGLWFVLRGQVKIYRIGPLGREQILCVMSPGTCFGGCPLFDSDIYPAMAQAVTEVTLYVLPRPDAQAIAQQSPAVAQALLRVFAGRLRHLSQLAEGLTFNCVVGRLAATVLAWADAGTATPRGIEVQQPLSQDDLAALLGTSPQVIRRAFLRLERLAALEAHGRHITILNRACLQQLSSNV